MTTDFVIINVLRLCKDGLWLKAHLKNYSFSIFLLNCFSTQLMEHSFSERAEEWIKSVWNGKKKNNSYGLLAFRGDEISIT